MLLLSKLGSEIGSKYQAFLKEKEIKLKTFLEENLSTYCHLIRIDKINIVVYPKKLSSSYDEAENKVRSYEKFNKNKDTNEIYSYRKKEYNFARLLKTLDKSELSRIMIPADLLVAMIDRIE